MDKNKLIGFFQASGIAFYVLFISYIMTRLTQTVGPRLENLAAVLFLILFVASAIITSMTALGYPAVLFFQKKKVSKAIYIVVYTGLWLLLYALVLLVIIIS